MNNTYISSNLLGWWGSEDMRVRCIKDGKVAFETEDLANKSAQKIRLRGDIKMVAYKGKCNNFHVGHKK